MKASTIPDNRYDKGYRADIDGLRALAVLAVLFFHAGYRGFTGGFTFFGISGFLIGGHIHAAQLAGRFTFADFYRRRARRILPALYVVAAAVLLLGTLLLSPRELQRAATEAIATLFSGSNFFYWKVTNYFAVASDQRTLLMTWSLGVEEQFYLIAPLLLVGLMRVKARLIPILAVLTFISFAIACHQVVHSHPSAFYLLPSRAWELLAGVLLAIVFANDRPSLPESLQHTLGALGLILIALPIDLLTTATPFPGISALPSVIGVALILCTPLAATNKAFRVLAPIGRISYSLYLWHWPLLTFTRIVLGTAPTRLQATAILAIAFVLATATYFFIEQPFRTSSTPARQLLLRYAAATAVLLLLCAAVRTTYGLASRAPALAREEKLATAPPSPCLAEDSITAPNTAAACIENTGRPAIALWGDSHAEALAATLRQKAHDAGYDFIEVEKGSCPPLANAARFFPESPRFASECLAFNAAALRTLEANPRIRIVVLAGYWRASLFDPYEKYTGWIVTTNTPQTPMPSLEASTKIFFDSLLHTITSLQRSGKQILLLQDVPAFTEDPLWRSRTAALPLRQWLIHRLDPHREIDPGSDTAMEPEANEIARTVLSTASHSTGAATIDPELTLCGTATLCQYRDAAHLYYQDNQHVTLAGARAALRELTFPSAYKAR